jgi:hypothetical protein
MTDDRTVHAETGYAEVVRYDRAGKWYVEDKGNHMVRPLGWRTQLRLSEVIEWMQDQPKGEVTVHWRKRGGKQFDAAIHRLILSGRWP